MKIVSDSVSRILLVCVWMIATNRGIFNPIWSLGIYYGAFAKLVLFNFIFSDHKPTRRSYYWIGLFLNSLGSILTYNHINFKTLIGKDLKEEDHKRRHQPSFLRQVLYTILMMMMMTGLTVDTLIKMQNEEFLPVTNIHGQEYELKRSFLEGVIIAAWIFQFLAVGLNLICYLIHPMAVGLSVTSKMFVYIWGTRFAFNAESDEKPEEKEDEA